MDRDLIEDIRKRRRNQDLSNAKKSAAKVNGERNRTEKIKTSERGWQRVRVAWKGTGAMTKLNEPDLKSLPLFKAGKVASLKKKDVVDLLEVELGKRGISRDWARGSTRGETARR